jgi:uncharacterized protein
MHRPIAQLVALALLTTAATPPAAAQLAAVDAHLPEIVSSATAHRNAPADLAVVTFRFSREGATPAEAGRNLALRADSIRRALRTVGISPDSVLSGSRWRWWHGRIQAVEHRRNIPRWVAYEGGGHRQDSTAVDTVFRAHESLEVRIRDMNRIGAVIDVALAQGITEISEITFSATDTERQQQEATREATQRARARAEVIALAGGTRLGRTLRLSTEGDHRPAPRGFVGLDDLVITTESAGAPARTVVVAPVIRVTVTVHGRWELVEER